MAELIVLTPELVNSTFAECIAPKFKRVKRVRVKVGKTDVVFDKAKLLDHYPSILLMLSDLPTEFQPKKMGGGNGWTLRNACKTKKGDQWTGLMVEVERLLAMGVAQGWVRVLGTSVMGLPLREGDQYVSINLPLPANFP